MKTWTKPLVKVPLVNHNVVIFDAYAWVEYVLDGTYADEVARWLEEAEEAFTPATVIAELKEAMLRHHVNSDKIKAIIDYIGSKTSIVNIDMSLASLAGEVNFEYKRKVKGWGMMDSFVYATSLMKGAKILTGDQHFRHLPNVIYIGR